MSENSEIEINEGNCVLMNDELFCIEITFEKALEHIKSECKQYKKERFDMIYSKINKLNDRAKHEMLMEDSRKNDTDIAILLG